MCIRDSVSADSLSLLTLLMLLLNKDSQNDLLDKCIQNDLGNISPILPVGRESVRRITKAGYSQQRLDEVSPMSTLYPLRRKVGYKSDSLPGPGNVLIIDDLKWHN